MRPFETAAGSSLKSNAPEMQKTDTSARLANTALRQRYSAEKRYTRDGENRRA
jgi:hypothetical protein